MAERAEIVLSGRDTSAAAFASAKRNLDSLQASAIGIAGKLGAVAAAATTAVVVLDRFNPAGVIQQADEFNKLTQRTGVAVEQLSAYAYAAKLADVSQEELSNGLKKLNLNIAAAARGEAEQAEAFKAIGVSVVDASGKVRSADQVFADIADRFQGYEDGANKVALANAVGGKSFEKLIPLLNTGSRGLAEAKKELQAFGGVIGGELAAKSEIFNDNLTKLGVAADALKVAIAGGLIDALVDYSSKAVEAAKEGRLLAFAFERMLDVLSGKASREFTFGKDLEPAKLSAQQVEVERLSNVIVGLQNNLSRDPGNTGLEQRLARMQARVKALNGEIAAAAKEALPGEQAKAFREFRASERAGADFSPAKKAAPALPSTVSRGGSRRTTAADNAEALLRKQLEGRLKTIQSTLERERDLFQFSQSQLAEQFNQGELSIGQFYDRQNQIRLDALAAQSKASADELALFKEYQAKFKKPADKADLGNRQTEAIERQAKAFREAGQAATVSEQQRVRATEDFQRSLVELDAQLAELSGNQYGAEVLRNAQRLDEARTLLARGGGDPARETALAARLAAQASFNELQEKSARISEQAQNAEEAFFIKASRLGLSRNDAETELLGLREKSIASLDRLIAETAELTRVSTDPELLAFYERIKLARERAFDAKDPGLTRFNELATQAGSTIADSFEDAVFSGKKLRDVIKDLDTQLAKLVFNDLVTQPLSGAVTGAIKGVGAGGSGGGSANFISGLLGKIGAAFSSSGGSGGDGVADVGGLSAKDLGGYFDNSENEKDAQTAEYAKLAIKFFSSFFHGGGVVGASGGTARAVNPMVFEGAARYHRGGLAGLAPDEVPAILRKREEVIRTDDPRHRDNGGMYGGQAVQPMVLNVSAPPGMDRKTANQYGADIGTGLQRALRRNG